MKTILELFLASGPGDAVPGNMTRFAALAAEYDLEFSRLIMPRKPDGSVEMQDLLRRVLQAQAFWINDPHMLSHPQIREAVETRLAEGAIAIARISTAHGPHSGAEFFQDMGLLPTSIRASVPRGAPNPYGHPMLFVADRQTYEMGFRDPTLFVGVDRLLLQQANGIGCVGGAQTILALPVGAIELIDMTKDLMVSVPRPELPVIASTSRPQWLGGRVIAMHTSIIGDSYVGPIGNHFPGIEGEDNEVFARNLLSVVAGARAPELSWETARSVAIQFETAIARVIHEILTGVYGGDWFERTAPEKVRIKCREDWTRNRCAATPQSYLNLIQFIELFKTNWSVIESALVDAGCKMTLIEAKAAISQVNPIRNAAMHVTKVVYGDRPAPTTDEMAVLRRYADMMVSAERAVRHLHRARSSPNDQA